MNEPSEQEDPHHGGEAELDDGHEQPSLQQLSQSGNKKAAKRRDHIAG